MAMNLKKLLPRILRIDFWQDFIDAVNTELLNFKTDQIDPLLKYWDISNTSDTDDLLEISKTLGYTPDRSLDSSLEHLRREIRSIIFRVINKSNYESYYFTFKNIPYLGNVYILFYNDVKLVRAIKESEIITQINQQNWNEPFQKFEPDYHYWAFIQQSTSFDLDAGLFLDATPTEKLDQNLIRYATNNDNQVQIFGMVHSNFVD
jgi:hypothetical protein